MATQIPSVNVNFVDGSGKITSSWYRLLTDLSQTVNNNNVDVDSQQAFAFMSDQDQSDDASYVDNQPVLWANDEGSQQQLAPPPYESVTLGSSPATYTATTSGYFLVVGGTVSLIEITRNGVSVATGLTFGFVPLEPYDQIEVTYTVLPTTTFIARAS
jgi:hypothetical protein